MIDPQVFPFVTAKPPRLEGAAYDNSHIPIKLTYTNPPLLRRELKDFFFASFFVPDLGFCIWSGVRIYCETTIYKPSSFKRESDGISVRHRKAPQSWGSAFGAGITYITWQPYTNPPFLERGVDGKQKTERGAPFF